MNPSLAPQRTANRSSRMVRFRVLSLLLACFGGSAAFAAVPHVINYQGYLADAAGQAVTGDVTVTFKLYASATATDSLWSGTYPVTVAAGFLEKDLGPIDLDFASPVYVGITVNSDAEMTPRRMLTSVPYAYRALSAENDSDTLATLSCASGQIAKWSGAVWQCAADAAGTGGISGVTAGTGLAGGGTSGTVALYIPSNGVNSAMLQDNVIDSIKIADGAIGNADLAISYAGSATKGGDAAGLTCTGCVAGDEIGSAAVVKSINTLTDTVTLNAGSGIDITAAANAITISAAATPLQAVTVINASNIGSVTIAPGSMVHLGERINLASVSGWFDKLKKENLYIEGGGIIGTGSQILRLGMYSVIVNTYFENVTLYADHNTFLGCKFGNNVNFSSLNSTVISGRFGPGTITMGGGLFLIGGSITDVQQTDLSGKVDNISAMTIQNSKIFVSRLHNSVITDSEVSLDSATDNKFERARVTFMRDGVFSGNDCEYCFIPLANTARGSVTISNNRFEWVLAGQDSIISVDATDSAARDYLVSDNTFNVGSSTQHSVVVTGSPTGYRQTIKISGNTFTGGAIAHVGNFKTIVTDNVTRDTQLGVAHDGSVNWVLNNIIEP